MCIFSAHSLIKDPPFSSLDLISCRNVLIYFGAELQKKLVPLFHYALRAGGYLLLGPSESLAASDELFLTVDASTGSSGATRRCSAHPSSSRWRPGAPHGSRCRPRRRRMLPSSPLAFSHGLRAHGARGVRPALRVVNERGDILYLAGRTGRYLQVPRGLADQQHPRHGAGQPAGSSCALRSRAAVQTRQRKVVRDNLPSSVDGRPAAPAADGPPAAGRRARRRASTPSCSRPAESLEDRGRGARTPPRRPSSRSSSSWRTSCGPPARTPGRHGGARVVQRGAQVRQRGAALDQRGAAVGQRGAADLQGGAAVGQRRAASRRCRSSTSLQTATCKSTSPAPRSPPSSSTATCASPASPPRPTSSSASRGRHRPAAPRPGPAFRRGGSAAVDRAVLERISPSSGTSTGRRHLVPGAHPALSHPGRCVARGRGHLRGHHRSSQGRGGRATLPPAARSRPTPSSSGASTAAASRPGTTAPGVCTASTPRRPRGRDARELLHEVFPTPWPEVEATLRSRGQWEGEVEARTKGGLAVTVTATLSFMRRQERPPARPPVGARRHRAQGGRAREGTSDGGTASGGSRQGRTSWRCSRTSCATRSLPSATASTSSSAPRRPSRRGARKDHHRPAGGPADPARRRPAGHDPPEPGQGLSCSSSRWISASSCTR